MAEMTFNEQIARMKHLAGFDEVKENKSTPKSVSSVEYHQKGPDGNTYGIIREGHKYYIKSAPAKDGEVLAEDYDYIGGINNKKAYEYTTYTVAAKQFGLKMMSLNEAYSGNRVSTDITARPEKQWSATSADAQCISESVNRFYEMLYNMGECLAEDKKRYAAEEHKFGTPKVNFEGGNPFVEVPMDTDKVNNLKNNETDPKKADKTFTEKGVFKEVFSSATEKGKDDPYSDDINRKYIEGVAVFTEKGNMNKGKKMNESVEKSIACNDDKDYMDKSHGTKVGSSEPYTERVNEDEVKWEETMGSDSVEDDMLNSDDSEGEIDYEIGIDDNSDIDDNIDIDDDDIFVDDEGEDDDMPEYVTETVMHDFGKHPAYRKEPMTMPDDDEPSTFGREWDDDSVKGKKPFGTSKGNSAPYTDAVIDMLTDSIFGIKKK